MLALQDVGLPPVCREYPYKGMIPKITDIIDIASPKLVASVKILFTSCLSVVLHWTIHDQPSFACWAPPRPHKAKADNSHPSVASRRSSSVNSATWPFEEPIGDVRMIASWPLA